MGPINYYLGKVGDWDALAFEKGVMVENEQIPISMKTGKRGALIGIKAPEELMSWGMAKLDGGVLRLASILGCYELKVEGVVEGDFLNLVCLGESGSSMSSKVFLAKEWTMSLGRKKDLKLQAVKRSESVILPVSDCWAIRGGHGFNEGVEVFLTNIPKKVSKCRQGAEIDCGDYKFLLEDSDESRLALEGKVQWYIPNEQGIFQKA